MIGITWHRLNNVIKDFLSFYPLLWYLWCQYHLSACFLHGDKMAARVPTFHLYSTLFRRVTAAFPLFPQMRNLKQKPPVYYLIDYLQVPESSWLRFGLTHCSKVDGITAKGLVSSQNFWLVHSESENDSEEMPTHMSFGQKTWEG